MKLKKAKLAFGIFHDGLSIKIAQLAADNGNIKIQRLEKTELSYPLYLKETPEAREQKAALEEGLDFPEASDMEDEELSIPEISEFDEEDSFKEVEQEEALSGKSDLQKLLFNFPLVDGKIALSADDEQISYNQFDETYATTKLKKKLQSELLSKEEIKVQNYELDYIINPDKTILAFTHRGDFELLKALQDTDIIVSKKKFFYSFIDTNEISLMNLVRTCYDFPPEEYVLILYIGVDYKVGIVMKGKSHYKTFPIIVAESEPEKMRQAIYSKIMLEQDVSNIPITQHVILVGENVSDEDVESFQTKCNSGASINRLELNKIEIDENFKDAINPEKIAEYAIPIALAWKTIDPKNKDFFPCNLLPSKIIESQKHFKVAWHGFLILGAIFYFTFMGTTKNMTLNQQVLDAQVINRNLSAELQQNKRIVAKLSETRKEINVLKGNVSKIEKLIGNKNQWHYILNVIANAFLENEISWINNLTSSEDKFKMTGYTTQKRNILGFSKLFPDGKIKNITRYYTQDLPIWKYEMTYAYPNPKDIEKEKEESISKIQVAEVTQKQSEPESEQEQEPEPKPESEPVIKEPVKPETEMVEVSEVDIKKIYNNIVYLYFNKDTDEAYEKFKDFVLQYPTHKLAHNANYLMGECLYKAGKIPEAKVIFEDIIKQEGTKSPDALMMLGNSYLQENDINKAIYCWNQLLINFPNNKLAIIARNKINIFSTPDNIYREKPENKTKTKIDEEIEETQLTSEILQSENISDEQYHEKEVYELLLSSGRDYLKVEHDKNEIEQLGYKTKINSILKDGEVSYRLVLDDSYTQSEANTLGEKIKKQFPFINNYWTEKLLYDDDITEIYQSIINIYFSGNFQETLEKLKEFIDKYPNHTLSYNATYIIGECLYQMGRVDEAKKIFENTIRLNGVKTPDALMMLGNCYNKENDINSAIYYWKQLIINFPDNKLSKIAQYKIKISESN